MKNLLFILSLLPLFSINGQEIQHKDELGGGIGVINYKGDLSPKFKIEESLPAVQLFYRSNYPNNYSVLRVNLLVGALQAAEKNYNNPLPEARDLSFSTTIAELAVMYEYNFLNYREITAGTREDYYLSPYLYGGLGAAIVFGGSSPAYIVLPIGVGLKYQLSPKMNLGVEVGVRKTFTDELDGYADDVALSSSIKFDSYYTSSITLSYTFYNDLCASHYK